MQTDNAYDILRCRNTLTQRRVRVRIVHKGIDSSERLGCHRVVIRHTPPWLNWVRCFTIRYERRGDIQQALLPLCCALLCFNALS